MTTPFPFVASTVLTAAQMNAITTLPIATKTASYTAVLGDVGKRIVMNVASANTVTINNSIFSEGDTIFISNKGAGSTTVTAGAGVTINTSGSLTLATSAGGTLVALSASTFGFFSGGATGIPSAVSYLVIAGGGGGATGGGGAGGYRNSVSGEDSGGGAAAETPFAATSGVTYTITVGAGGATQTIGDNSSIAGTGLTTITSTGGGRGGLFSNSLQNGGNGGSGGGSGTSATAPFTAGSVGTGTANQGFAGGLAVTGATAYGGGGGSDAVGSAGVASTGGNGGAGNSSSITGSSVGRGGGGGGAGSTGGTGTQGGGNGSQTTPTAGTANSGGGGGGINNANNLGAAGGKGVVIIRTPDTDTGAAALGATVTQTGGYYIYTFNDSGTIKWGV